MTHRLRAVLLAGVLAPTAACTDAQLYEPPGNGPPPLDNRLTLTGGFCAEGAEQLRSFLKVMLIIDRSNSMNRTDPANRRIDAARDLIMRFVDDPVTLTLQPGVEIAVISFFGETVVHTRDDRGVPGFSRDGAQILFSLTQVAQTGANTGYDKALAQAYTILNSDMARLDDRARGLSRYETIFLSDGLPFPDNCRGEANSPTAAVLAVQRIASLEVIHKVQHRLHTAFLSTPDMFTSPDNDVQCFDNLDPFEEAENRSIGDELRNLLQEMARVGKGSFAHFENGDAVTFQGFQFADARRIFELRNFIVSNTNAIPAGPISLADTDGDGLSDGEEVLIGSSPYSVDTDGDGFNDFLEWRYRLSGYDPLDPTDANCEDLARIDTDGDGLLDCEETFLGTLRRRFDTDQDGLPDGLEVRYRTNPGSATPLQDQQTDSDADNGFDADEVRWHTDPASNDVSHRSVAAYRYFQYQHPITTGVACYDFEVENITLASTGAPPDYQQDFTSDPRVGWNRIMLYFAQTPYDDPLGPPLYRVACVEARYVEGRDVKIPAGGRFDIPPSRPGDTWRMSPVLRPASNTCDQSVNQECGLDSYWCRFDAAGACSCWIPPLNPGDPPDGIPLGRPCFACSNGIDDDGDGFTDYPHDPNCFDFLDDNESDVDPGSGLPDGLCSNGIDDDGDGRVDWPEDPGCDHAYDNDETDPPTLPQCANGIDDDGDGAIDFPDDPGCFAANDDTEQHNLGAQIRACNDGLDNDGDGLIDLADPGCTSDLDVDEDGPSVCFFCELFSDFRPGQCDLRSGFCKARSGTPPTGACVPDDPAVSLVSSDCRGAPCVGGRCVPCLQDFDCGPGAVCDAANGWCLQPSVVPQPCATDDDCSGACDTDIGVCRIDPRDACRSDADCPAGEVCSEERGYCLTRVFQSRQCSDEQPCSTGRCDPVRAWCVPTQESDQCNHSDECPGGFCTSEGYCEQQTFVFPEEFRAEVDCLRAQ